MTKKIIGYDPHQKKTTYFHGGNDGQHYVLVEQETKEIKPLVLTDEILGLIGEMLCVAPPVFAILTIVGGFFVASI